MKPVIALVAALLLATAARGEAQSMDTTSAIRIDRNGTRPSQQGPEEWFTGRVRIDPLFAATETTQAAAATVTFEPAARTAWHTHPRGQTLIVTSGLGRVQREGGPVEQMRPGDVIWIPAGVKHWHGAEAAVGMSHIAIQEHRDGAIVEWLEQVSEAQYNRGDAP
jgi:quercetin dioxygenase-like cupin family protein